MRKKINDYSKLKIIFMGTPEFAVPILESINSNVLSPILVVTQSDKKVGRKQILTPSPVKILACRYKIPVFAPEKISDISSKLKTLSPELIIVAAYGQILPKEILDIPKRSCLNIHASLLPKYRGPSPIPATILNGDRKTGVTLMLMEEKMDTGPILGQKTLTIKKDETTESLSKKLSKLGAELLIEILPKWIKGEIKSIPQNEKEATYTKIIKKEDGKIDWGKSALEIERQIRAYSSWPSSYTYWQRAKDKKQRVKKMLKILKVNFPSPKSEVPLDFARGRRSPKSKIGTVFLTPKNKLVVQCGKGVLIIKELQLEGKQKMPASEFLRGHPDFVKSTLY
ncbi:MAG: methionyl-tRNA formyltransferase [Candidatus Aenigmarchaeota archaeon]|nr:methionyl-tRNA formyltransferase [Candidatus Aenigmarchaeota archaeon]